MPKHRKRNKRNWEPRELRLCSEALVRYYGEYPSQTHVHVGSLPKRMKGRFLDEAGERMLGEFRRWCDAIVIMPDRLVLIEAKIKPQPGVISQLLLYARLLPKTPELAEHKHKPIEMGLVCAIEDPLVTHLAREMGILVVNYSPVWIKEYLNLLYARERSPGVQTLEDEED